MGLTKGKRVAGLDVAKVRIPFEEELAQALGRNPEFRGFVAGLPKLDVKKVRRDLQAFTLALTESMAPTVYAAAELAMKRLGVDKPVKVYQAAGQSSAAVNAAVVMDEETVQIVIMGHEFNHFDATGKVDVMGHELGHYLAHGPRWAYHDIAHGAYLVAAHGGPERLERQARCLSVAKELTADRFALLASQDLDTHLKVHMVDASGIPMRELTWDPRGYLEQARQLMDETLTRGETARGDTHPEHNLRAYAAWLWSETEVYADLVGSEKAPTRKLAQVNTALRRLLNPEINWFGDATRHYGAPPPGPSEEPSARRHVRGRRPVAAPGAYGSFSGTAGTPKTSPDDPSREDEILQRASEAVGKARKALQPGLSKLGKATSDGVSRVLGRKLPARATSSESPPLEDDPDPLADEEQDLLDRFAALEEKMKGS